MGVFSVSLLNTCKKYNFRVEDYMFCLLVHQGVSPKDAYVAAFRPSTNSNTRIAQLTTEKRKEIAVASFIAKLEDDAMAEKNKLMHQASFASDNRSSGEAVSPESFNLNDGIRSKEDIINELNGHISRSKDDKEKREWIKMLIEVTQMKKESDTTEADTIHYYFPISCSDCSFNPDKK